VKSTFLMVFLDEDKLLKSAVRVDSFYQILIFLYINKFWHQRNNILILRSIAGQVVHKFVCVNEVLHLHGLKRVSHTCLFLIYF